MEEEEQGEQEVEERGQQEVEEEEQRRLRSKTKTSLLDLLHVHPPVNGRQKSGRGLTFS